MTKYNFGEFYTSSRPTFALAAINEAFGYQHRLKQWKANPQGKEPGLPKAGRTFPAMYRDVMLLQSTDNRYVVKIKERST